ncbi:MAG: DUF4145 domain-containing protein [Ferrovibrio sp.]|uniref:DUF4145 domain-containing protein n=1 Tax=Ferrovibrio sp. TaxID=1917215 RepID=UPI002629EE9B|nr:DUF4145 domain-containing protein [Ferrovibrio sp.]MCW0233758.1 DUF4145 domain-containing protein [Ferrovibrio sp.]
MEVSGDPALNGWIAKKIWPEEEAVDIPDFLPDNVRVPFQQALDNLTRKNWDAAGMMFRKALEVGTKAIDPSLASKKLVVRIDELAARYAITPDLKDWAHKIRIGGNDAAHDDDPFEETEAVDLEYFCRLFLTYVFTLPAKLKQRVDSNP